MEYGERSRPTLIWFWPNTVATLDDRGWTWSSVSEGLLSVCKALGSSPSTKEEVGNKTKRRKAKRNNEEEITILEDTAKLSTGCDIFEPVEQIGLSGEGHGKQGGSYWKQEGHAPVYLGEHMGHLITFLWVFSETKLSLSFKNSACLSWRWLLPSEQDTESESTGQCCLQQLANKTV